MLNDYKINTFSKPVSALADRPRLTPAELKTWFDSNSTNEVKTSINNLIDALVALNGANEIGANVEGIAQQTVFGVLTALKVLIDDRYTIAQTDTRLNLKFDEANAQDLVRTVNIDPLTGVFTITKYDGTVQKWDTAIEKVAIDVKLDGTDFVLTLVDGTEQRVSLAAFVDTYNFATSDTIQVVETAGNSSKNYVFNIRAGSITTSMMDPQLLTTITGYVESASASAARAAKSAESALNAKNDAQASASSALASMQNAGQSEANALLYKNAAETSASEAEMSAKQASASASAAASSETVAQASATSASASKTSASQSEANALASKNAAATSAAEAAKSASTALASETSATASKEAAAKSAQDASASASSALSSKNAAGASAAASEASAVRAEDAATRAEQIAGLEVLVKADIVNNLTAGGADKVLSAEQGKQINSNLTSANQSISQLQSKTDATNTEVAKKVDKVSGKGLSTNDYTTPEKDKLAGLFNYDDTVVKKDLTDANVAIGQLQKRVDDLAGGSVTYKASKTVFTNVITTTYADGVETVEQLANGDILKTFTGIDGKISKLRTVFNADGSIEDIVEEATV